MPCSGVPRQCSEGVLSTLMPVSGLHPGLLLLSPDLLLPFIQPRTLTLTVPAHSQTLASTLNPESSYGDFPYFARRMPILVLWYKNTHTVGAREIGLNVIVKLSPLSSQASFGCFLHQDRFYKG